jgi:hypothetical protein
LIVTALLKHRAFFYDTYSHLKRKGDPAAPALYSQPNGTMPRREPEEIIHMSKTICVVTHYSRTCNREEKILDVKNHRR